MSMTSTGTNPEHVGISPPGSLCSSRTRSPHPQRGAARPGQVDSAVCDQVLAVMASLETDVVLLPEELQHGVQDGGGVGRAGSGVVLGIAGAAPHRHLQQPAAAAVCWEEYIARPKPDQNPAQFCAYKTVTLRAG